MARLARGEYAQDPVTAANRLLGCRLTRVLESGERLAGVIVEVEAYLGEIDQASHAFKGRRSDRNESMYAQAGTSYVYFTYGMHFCFNVVCADVGVPHAVLIRALEPVEGLDAMKTARAAGRNALSADRMKPRDLCSGPGKLCSAMRIDRGLNGVDLTKDKRLWIDRGEPVSEDHISAGPRIGIDSAGDWRDRPLRFWITGNEHVSGARRV